MERCWHPKDTLTLSSGPRGSDTAQLCVWHPPATNTPSSLPSCDRHFTLHLVPVSKLSTASPRPTPSGNRLPGICSPRL